MPFVLWSQRARTLPYDTAVRSHESSLSGQLHPCCACLAAGDRGQRTGGGEVCGHVCKARCAPDAVFMRALNRFQYAVT